MTTTTSPRVEHIAPGKIKPHPSNVRTDLGDLTELTDSIKAKGVLQPLVVAPNGNGYVLIAGHRRHAAALAAGLKEVTVVVRDDLDTEPAQLEAMLIENVHRADLTPVEEGDAYQQLLAFDGYDVKTISAKTGRAARTIRDRVAIAKLPDNARAAVSTGRVTLEQASQLAQLAKDDPTAVERLEEEFGSSHFPFSLQRAVQAAERAKKVAKLRAGLEKDGLRIVPKPGGFPWSSHSAKALRGQLDNVYSYTELHLSVDEHRHLDCHAVIDPGEYVREEDAAPVHLCTDPSSHPRPGPEQEDDVDDSDGASGGSDVTVRQVDPEVQERIAREREEQEKALAEDRQNREAAAALRKAHIETLMRQALPAQHLPHLVGCVMTRLTEYGVIELDRPGVVLPWLGVDYDDSTTDYDDDLAFMAKEFAAKDLGRQLLAALAADIEPLHGSAWSLFRLDQRQANWLRALAAMGYDLSPYEQGLLEDHDARVAAAAAEAEDDESGDDE